MKPNLRLLLSFCLATLGAYVVGAVSATQVNLARLDELGVRITLRDRLYASGHDLFGLATSYLPLLGIAFLVAFPLATRLARWTPELRLLIYGIAGTSAVIALHLVAKAVLGLNGLAAVRSTSGLVLQGVAGWFGAYVYFVATGWAHRSSPPLGEPPRA